MPWPWYIVRNMNKVASTHALGKAGSNLSGVPVHHRLCLFISRGRANGGRTIAQWPCCTCTHATVHGRDGDLQRAGIELIFAVHAPCREECLAPSLTATHALGLLTTHEDDHDDNDSGSDCGAEGGVTTIHSILCALRSLSVPSLLSIVSHSLAHVPLFVALSLLSGIGQAWRQSPLTLYKLH